MELMNTISGLLGLALGIFSSYITYIAFVNPLHRFRKYLANPSKWEEISTDVNDEHSFYRYSKHPGFIIKRDDAKNSRSWDNIEPWMPHCPDLNKSSIMVHLIVNGQVLLAEEFIFLDGARYFVPVPRRKMAKSADDGYIYWYTELQVKIAEVIGRHYRTSSVEEFMKSGRIKFVPDVTIRSRLKSLLSKYT